MKAKTIYSQRPDEIEVVSVPDGAIAYFRENIEECAAPGDDGGTCFRCDEYLLPMRCPVDVAETRIATNPEVWAAKAKEQEAEREAEDEAAGSEPTADLLMEVAADHEERICMLELLGEGV